MAARFGHARIAAELVAVGINVNARGFLHQTALHVAARYGHEEVLRLLIRMPQCDVTARTSTLETASPSPAAPSISAARPSTGR